MLTIHSPGQVDEIITVAAFRRRAREAEQQHSEPPGPSGHAR
jgi:hypothetical protein